jgi:hypothetical protein
MLAKDTLSTAFIADWLGINATDNAEIIDFLRESAFSAFKDYTGFNPSAELKSINLTVDNKGDGNLPRSYPFGAVIYGLGGKILAFVPAGERGFKVDQLNIDFCKDNKIFARFDPPNGLDCENKSLISNNAKMGILAYITKAFSNRSGDVLNSSGAMVYWQPYRQVVYG